jgi:CheY-like chemotaxis protein
MTRRILLVDDDRMNRLVAERMLERLGWEVTLVGDGAAAVAAAAAGDFDAIIMDCQMPTMDGFQATEAIRQREARHHSARTRIIGLSARTMVGDSEAAIAHGMDAYLTKPVNERKLKAALDEL